MARSRYAAMLTPYEESEIFAYSEIYYVGLFSRKNTTHGSERQNYGFDNASHHYRAVPGDHIAYRYEIKSILGQGAFGQVLSCYDHKEHTTVALKIVINTPQMLQQGMAEMSILDGLNAQEGANHLLKIFDTFVFRGHVCATFELLGHDLYQLLKMNRFTGLPLRSVRIIGRQILRGLEFVHSQGIVHCDMKPENILLVPPSSLKVCIADFGSACRIGQKHFEYIQSRYYRAPEVILGLKYGPPIDIWSFACIMAELATGQPIFPGHSEVNQLMLQIETLGMPNVAIIASAPRKGVFFCADGSPRGKILKRRSIKAVTGIQDADLLELLERCFEWDQTKRITAREALELPFFERRVDPTRVVGEKVLNASVARDLSPRWVGRPRSIRA
jgi:dual specificity tyrosine-phosphorylation-regulated kinase 2/3/4